MLTPVDVRHIDCSNRPRFVFQDETRWLPVAGFPGYEVSNDGRVRSSLAAGFGRAPSVPRELKRCSDGHGYFRVYLRREGRTHSLKVAWLVLAAFEGPRPVGMDACHGDGYRDNDVVGNLRWDTRKGNLADCLAHGTRTRGARVGRSKLSEDEVRAIRARVAAGEPQSEVGASFGVAQSTVSKINIGARWAWLS